MKLISLLLVLCILLITVPSSASFYCDYARYNPGFLVLCLWDIMMETWDPLDWGDGDADDYGNGSIIVEFPEFYYVLQHKHGFTAIPRAG